MLTTTQPGGQDNQLVVKDLTTRVDATYLLQTNDDPPAYITARSRGWRTGQKEVLERLNDPMEANSVPANQYRFRMTVELETGDERYSFVNSCIWVGSACRRSNEGKMDPCLCSLEALLELQLTCWGCQSFTMLIECFDGFWPSI